MSLVDAGKLGRIFSTRVLKDISAGLSPAEVDFARDMLVKAGRLPPCPTLREVFDVAFAECARSQRVEYVYKNALVEKVLLGRHSIRTSSAHFEVRIHQAKLDVLLVRDGLIAYEIKTERDELSRLRQQIHAYQRACPTVWVFTCDKHLSSAERLLPASVGIATLSKRYQIRRVRPAERYSDALRRMDMLRLLRKDEQAMVLDELGVKSASVPNTRLFAELGRAAETVDELWIEGRVSSFLRARGAKSSALASGLPKSLAASALAQDLTAPRVQRLIAAFAAN